MKPLQTSALPGFVWVSKVFAQPELEKKLGA
jgi:hypothetical protein